MTSTTSTSSRFELLPPELQCHILKRLPDWKTLYALIQASPRHLEVYRRSKEGVLAHITRNCITPSVFPIAFDVLEMRQQREPHGNRPAVLSFLKSFLQESPGHPDLSLETSKTLLQFHDVVEFFISDLTTTRLAIINGYTHPEQRQSPKTVIDTSESYDLSVVERSRLARALYYLELYGQLFYTPERPENQITVVEQATMFLERLKDWELEEFLCIRTYLIEKLTVFLNQVEDDFLEEFIDEGPSLANGHYQRWDNDDMFFSTTCHGAMQRNWIEGCLTRGLAELKEMFIASTSEERLDAIGDEGYPRMGLRQALKEISDHPRRARSSWEMELNSDAAFHDDVETYNAGCLWAMRCLGQPRHANPYDREFDTLRRIGYSIWDHERLARLGILSKR